MLVGGLCKRTNVAVMAGIALCLAFFYLVAPRRYDLQDLLSYSTRPLFDVSEAPKDRIRHIRANGLIENDTETCTRHGLERRKERNTVIWDATLINTELDLLEIRIRELWDVVDLFLLVESSHTMTGIKKERLTFRENQIRFKPFQEKLRYKLVEGRSVESDDGLFSLANAQRNQMKEFINSFKPLKEVLVLMSDVDEIPSQAAMSFIKLCETPLPLHLQLQNYVYSFEFATLADSWRAQVHRWIDSADKVGYTHGKSTESILTGAGWHCSNCFRTLAEFKTKLMSASHIDRLLKRPKFQRYLTDASIQERICDGKDLLDMPPEAYTWSDLASLWGGARRLDAVIDAPLAVAQDWSRFAYLLPGNCKREPGKLDKNINSAGLPSLRW